MPQVKFLGPFHTRRYPDGKGEFIRNKSVTVTQAWLDLYRGHLPSVKFLIEGDNPPTIDEGGDGIPDKNWRVKDIRSWLEDYNMNPTGYASKGALLDIVDKALNPNVAEEVIVDIEEQEEQKEQEIGSE